MKIVWKKCPAVTTGGKTHYWFTRKTRVGPRWVVWDRNLKSWIISNDSNAVMAIVSNEKIGKIWVKTNCA